MSLRDTLDVGAGLARVQLEFTTTAAAVLEAAARHRCPLDAVELERSPSGPALILRFGDATTVRADVLSTETAETLDRLAAEAPRRLRFDAVTWASGMPLLLFFTPTGPCTVPARALLVV